MLRAALSLDRSRGLDYFRRRLVQAPRDSREALELTLKHCDTYELQQAAVGALTFKCNLLWALLDAIALRFPGEALQMNPDNKPGLAPHVYLQRDPVTGEPVLVFPEEMLALNEEAEAILSRCDGRTQVAEIIEALLAEYEADREELSHSGVPGVG